MTNVDIFLDELGKLPHDNGSNLTWFVETDPINRVVKIVMKDRTSRHTKTKALFYSFDDIYEMPDPRYGAALAIENMYYDFGEHIIDRKLLISPEEALKRLKELSEDLSRGWVDIYADNADEDVIEALDVAIACLEEKCHE